MVKKGEKRNVTWVANPKGNPAFGKTLKFPTKYGERMTRRVHLHLSEDVYQQLLILVDDSHGLTLQDVIRRELGDSLTKYAKST